MKKKLKPVPKFNSEQEDRAFWESDGNDSAECVEWFKAKRVEFPNLQLSTKTISIRLPQGLLDRIRMQANRPDVPYQSLMKVWLAEKAEEAGAARGRTDRA